MRNSNECVVCGAEAPECDRICTICKKTVKNNTMANAEADIRKAAVKVKEFCLTRIHKHKDACKDCPIKDICFNAPYLWEV